MRKCLNDHSSSFYKLPMNLTKYGGNFSAVFKIILHWCQTEIFYIEVVCWLFNEKDRYFRTLNCDTNVFMINVQIEPSTKAVILMFELHIITPRKRLSTFKNYKNPISTSQYIRVFHKVLLIKTDWLFVDWFLTDYWLTINWLITDNWILKGITEFRKIPQCQCTIIIGSLNWPSLVKVWKQMDSVNGSPGFVNSCQIYILQSVPYSSQRNY